MSTTPLNFIITVLNAGALTSVTSDNIPAKLRRHLELAITMALDFEAEEEEIRPIVTVGGITPEDTARLALLDALISYGVDNWEGYSLAVTDVYGEQDEPTDEAEEAA